MSRASDKQWFAVDITVDAPAVEAVEYAFNVFGSLGTEISDLKSDLASTVCVVGYFELPPDEADLQNVLNDALRIYGQPADAIVSLRTRVVLDADWLAEWKKHWQPTAIGKLIIAPPWSEVAASDKIVIRIEPNMAFGTGTHETTQLCLKQIGAHFRDGMSFLDVGTGTGILAIAAAKISAVSMIDACDTDVDSIKIARENAIATGVADRVQFFEGSISGDTPAHDLVCANLTLDVITPLLPMLIEKATQSLLLSGILGEQEDAIKVELSKFQISNFKVEYAGEWLSVIILK